MYNIIYNNNKLRVIFLMKFGIQNSFLNCDENTHINDDNSALVIFYCSL
jgi:hypothetical protein